MKKIATLVLCCTAALCAWAVPARREGRLVTQADGTEIMVYNHGDESFHWQTNENGEWIEQGEDGNYTTVPALSEEQIQVRRAKGRRLPQQTMQAYPTNIAPRGLIILVNFKDKAFVTDKAEIEDMINGENYTRKYSYTYRKSFFQTETVNVESQGSARQYFHDVSFGQYNPHFDVVGPVTVSQNYSYYGKNDQYGNDAHPEEMVKEACQLAYDQYNIDFLLYDNDGDNTVDFVYILYAGYGEADGGASNTVWPHAYSLTEAGTSLALGGKKIDKYACSNEMSSISGYHDGIGTFCHEFTHVLGLPDFYNTANGSNRTLGNWDIMDYGCYNNDGNTPCAFSGYERFFCGWATPELLVDPAYYSLKELNGSNTVLLISTTDQHNLIGNDPDPATFYLLENRQQTGWDKYLNGHGLMLTKVNYSYSKWYNNNPNNTASNMGVDIIEAKTNTSSTNKATDLFPTGATSYTGIADHSITGIKEENGIIYFSYKGGTDPRETAIENIAEDEQVLGIYTLTGKSLPVNSELPHGVYIMHTNKGSHKIVR